MQRRFHHLVRAIIEQDGHYLLAQAKGSSNTFLPGGHLEPFERLTDSLARELREEMGMTVPHFTYLGVMENEYVERGIQHVELCHLFRAEEHGLTPAQAVPSREAHLEFLWVSPDRFGELNLLPAGLRDFLPDHREFRGWHGT